MSHSGANFRDVGARVHQISGYHRGSRNFQQGEYMKNFFSALTDRSFKTFITRPVASVLYLISMILVGVSVAIFMVGGLIALIGGDFALGFFGLIIVPLLGLLILILTRLFFESGIALILIAENTKK
jgi:hypothetical protein